jgi:4-hydroxy-tetrahydrodipicolinate reductase
MGRAIARLALEARAGGEAIELVGAVDAAGSPWLGRDVGELVGAGHAGVIVEADLGAGLLGAEVLVDFSHASVFDRVVRAASRAKVGLVSGTTGLGEASLGLLDEVAGQIPVLWAPNMSLGVQVLARLVREAVAALGSSYDVEVVETHHNQKADAPSGTATLLVQAAREVRAELEPRHGRHGQLGPREAREIGVHALRGGAVVGDHTVHLVGAFDRLEITHRAMSRDLFAAGALRAARFVAGRAPGRYTLADVLDADLVRSG